MRFSKIEQVFEWGSKIASLHVNLLERESSLQHFPTCKTVKNSGSFLMESYHLEWALRLSHSIPYFTDAEREVWEG